MDRIQERNIELERQATQDRFSVEVAAEIKPQEMHVIVKGLTAYNASKANGDTPQYLMITVRDQEQNVVGGLVGASYLGWVQVQAVWLDDSLRGQGYGKDLMRKVEEEALRRACPRIVLETLSFQALGFYEKLGYTIVSRLDGFPPGGTRYALTKML